MNRAGVRAEVRAEIVWHCDYEQVSFVLEEEQDKHQRVLAPSTGLNTISDFSLFSMLCRLIIFFSSLVDTVVQLKCETVPVPFE